MIEDVLHKCEAIQVGPFPYLVAWTTKDVTAEDLKEMGVERLEHLGGYHDAMRAEIRITEIGPSNQRKRSDFIHETLHAIMEVVGMQPNEKWNEEQICTNLAPMLLQVMQQNPEWVRTVTETR